MYLQFMNLIKDLPGTLRTPKNHQGKNTIKFQQGQNTWKGATQTIGQYASNNQYSSDKGKLKPP